MFFTSVCSSLTLNKEFIDLAFAVGSDLIWGVAEAYDDENDQYISTLFFIDVSNPTATPTLVDHGFNQDNTTIWIGYDNTVDHLVLLVLDVTACWLFLLLKFASGRRTTLTCTATLFLEQP